MSHWDFSEWEPTMDLRLSVPNRTTVGSATLQQKWERTADLPDGDPLIECEWRNIKFHVEN